MLKIAIWTRTSWAFGQIFNAIKKYSSHQIDLFDWKTPYPENAFDGYDIVHVPVVQAYDSFKDRYPSYKGKVCVSAHGVVELYNYNPATTKRHATCETEIDAGVLPKEMVAQINYIGSMACVSKQLVDIVKTQTTAKAYYTPCGVDATLFKGDIIEHDKLVVLCPTTIEDMGRSEHEYNVKRYNLVLEIEKRLPNVTFQFLDKRIPTHEMPSFYSKGDIILCVSHSEGGPLGITEAGAMGVLPITTPVGDTTSFITNGVNGVVLEGDIVESAVSAIARLDRDRQTLFEMRKNIQNTVLSERTWIQLIRYWDNYFLNISGKKVFVEIGSNCFETLLPLAKEGWRGVIVEPVPEYFHKLPIALGVAYEKVAIGNPIHPKEVDFNYISSQTVTDYALPNWATGLGSFSKHPTITNNGWEKLVSTVKVPVMSFQELVDKHGIEEIDYLKIDTEGFDCEILKQVDFSKVDKITFENNSLSDKAEVSKVLDRLHEYGFLTTTSGDNVHAVKSSMLTELRKQGIPLTSTPDKFTFHLISLVHLPQSVKYNSCAFTQKNLKLAKMLTKLGHTVYFYGSEGSDVADYVKSDNLIFVQTHTLSDIRKAWGDGDNRFEIGYDWTATDFRHDFNTEKTEATKKFYAKCIEEIKKNSKPDHFLLLTMGTYHHPIADAVGLFLRCEPGIGYRGSSGKNYRAFESSYIQNFSYGSANPFQSINGSYYDRVIPNYFDPNDFEFSDEKEDYILYIGRMIKRKGIMTADLVSRELNIPLYIVGQGGVILPNGRLEATTNSDISIPKGNWEYLGFADVPKRKKLMAKARATFVATEYLECFGGTHIESMISGTPPITTNFAVFPETIPDFLNGKVGFRCNTLDDFVKATVKAKDVDHKFIRQYSEKFLMDNVALEFDKWFRDLYAVWESTVIPGKKGWHRINP